MRSFILGVLLLAVGCGGEVPVTLDQYIDKETQERYCAVMQYEDGHVDWNVPNLALVSTGTFYSATYRAFEIKVFPDGGWQDCDCVPGLTPHRTYRVRGRLWMSRPGEVRISDATVELAGGADDAESPATPVPTLELIPLDAAVAPGPVEVQ